MHLATAILAWAREVGFDRVGIASLEPSRHTEALDAWLARGDQASMGYLERGRAARADPASLLPGARSAVVVALHYAPLAGGDEPDGDLWPRVARYARGVDYHQLMLERLRALAARVSAAHPESACRPWVDTGPILERELAARAGLGAFGKNTNLLARGVGSWFLLGELLTTLDLPASGAVPYDVCGRCTRCLDACPTGALPAPYRLDARRCISFWTIEHRGAIPAEVRSTLGDWVFGCDVCQEVCPYNRRPLLADHPALALPDRRRELDLVGLLSLDREGYVERFRGSAMKRAKREGLQRNAAVAMGNRGDPRYLPALVAALAGDDSPLVRAHAAWALGRLGGPAAQRALAEAEQADPDPGVCAEARAALAALAVPAPSPPQPQSAVDTRRVGP